MDHPVGTLTSACLSQTARFGRCIFCFRPDRSFTPKLEVFH
jgi:hypothetical protein